MSYFQSFCLPTAKPFLKERVSHLRNLFTIHSIDGYLIPCEDNYFNEYVPDYNQRLPYITGFTGSWGLTLILKDTAILWVDSRYTVQAKQQTDTNIFTLYCTADHSVADSIKEKISSNIRLGLDPSLFTQNTLKKYSIETYKPIQSNLVDLIWHNRPQKKLSKVTTYPLKYAGISHRQKIDSLVTELADKKQDAFIMNSPEEICWLLNIRGKDVPHTPLILSRAILEKSGILYWYIDSHRIEEALIASFLSDNIILKNPEQFETDIIRYTTIETDPSHKSLAFDHVLDKNSVTIIEQKSPIEFKKSIKNATEIEAIKQAHRVDAKAMIRFIDWFEEQEAGKFTEIDCVKALESFRRESLELQDISFDTIAGSGPNGAIVHYRVTEQSNRTIEDGDLFLCDSGGQYWGGTTDITRVLIKGTPTKEMKQRYTQVLKGHLALARAIFPKKTIGACLDGFARSPLWQAGIDFGHGTGHGVGCYLSVHEGPQNISPRSQTPFEAGMLISNEPGYYKEGHFGIRIENIELVIPCPSSENAEKDMLMFETLTLVPYEKKLIDPTLLTEEEREQIERYHSKITDNIT